MIRTRLAQAAAVATLAVGTVILLPTAASAAPAVQAAAASAPVPAAGATASPDVINWG
ncbi:hypothetical protein [Streptacidiphilus rugosus]|uniref:hypothetical protein n=1 Tax=Streptacidiphilus rugosus TaxID=405783 RepID=UPI000AB3A53B|nr:hypothetical protein [Streptacidiphilus rugosus]